MTTDARRRALSDWRTWLKLSLSTGIAVLFGWWVHTKGISLIPDPAQLAVYATAWWGPVGFVLFLAVVHVLRAYRWSYLLQPLTNRPVRLGTLFAIAFVGFMAIMVLPLRMGELARPYLISARGRISMSAAFGTIAIERVLDGLFLSGILTVCLLAVPRDAETPAWVGTAGVMTLGIFVAALVVLVLLLWKGAPAVDALERLGRRLSPRLASKIAGVLREFLEGLSALPSRRHLTPFVAMTVAYWAINGVGMWYLAAAADLPISIIGGFTIMSALGVGILIPTGPGQLGNFQAAVAIALGLEGVQPDRFAGAASAYIFVLYLGILGVTVMAGLVSMASTRISLFRAVGSREGPQ